MARRKRPRQGVGKWRSLKTGRYVSAYYAKRHPRTTERCTPEVEHEVSTDEGRMHATDAPLSSP